MRRAWISSRIVLPAAAVVLTVVLAAFDSAADAFTVIIFIGVPLMMAAVTVSVVTRRTR